MGSIYDVAIAVLESAAPADGFVDPKSSYHYMDANGDAPNTLALAKAKFRANSRYKSILANIQHMCNIRVISVSTPGATADTAPTSVTIRLQIEHDDSVMHTHDEINPGEFLTGTAALERTVARALILTKDVRGDYYDPTTAIGRDIDGAPPAASAKGTVIALETVGAAAASIAAAEAAITVTLVP